MRLVMTSYTVTGCLRVGPWWASPPKAEEEPKATTEAASVTGRQLGPARTLRQKFNPPARAAGAPPKARGNRRAGGGGVEPPRLPLEPKRLDPRGGHSGRGSGCRRAPRERPASARCT